MSSPRNAVGDTDPCTQAVAAKFVAPILPGWLVCRSRDGARDARTGPAAGDRTEEKEQTNSYS